MVYRPQLTVWKRSIQAHCICALLCCRHTGPSSQGHTAKRHPRFQSWGLRPAPHCSGHLGALCVPTPSGWGTSGPGSSSTGTSWCCRVARYVDGSLPLSGDPCSAVETVDSHHRLGRVLWPLSQYACQILVDDRVGWQSGRVQAGPAAATIQPIQAHKWCSCQSHLQAAHFVAVGSLPRCVMLCRAVLCSLVHALCLCRCWVRAHACLGDGRQQLGSHHQEGICAELQLEGLCG